MPLSRQAMNSCINGVYGHLCLPPGHLGGAYDALIVDLCNARYDAWSIAVWIIRLFLKKGRNELGRLTEQDAFDSLGPTEGLDRIDAQAIVDAAYRQGLWLALFEAVSALWLQKQLRPMDPDEIEDLWTNFLTNRHVSPVQVYANLCKRRSLSP